MKKSILFWFVLLLVCASFVSASAQNISGEISVLVRPDEGGVFEKYVPLFEAETGVKVTVDFVSWDEITAKTLTTLASGGGGYDVVFIPSADATKLMAGGWFEPITDMISDDPGAWLEALVKFYSDRDGNLLGIPWYSGASHFVYNKAILEAAAVDPESLTSWDAVLEACAKIKEVGAVEYCFTPSAKYPGNFYYNWGSVGHSFGAKFFDEEGTILFDHEEAVLNATKMYETGVKEGYFNPAGIAMSDYDALIEFGTGATAFMINSTWSATQATRNPELSSVYENAEIALLPGEFGTYLYGGAFGVLTASDNKDAAKAFIQFITSEEAQKDHAIEGGNLPTRVSLFTDADISAAWKGYDVLSAQLDHGDFAPKLEWFDAWRQAAATAIQDVLKESKSAEDAIEWLKAETENIIAEAE